MSRNIEPTGNLWQNVTHDCEHFKAKEAFSSITDRREYDTKRTRIRACTFQPDKNIDRHLAHLHLANERVRNKTFSNIHL
jgi:hypothetical protein